MENKIAKTKKIWKKVILGIVAVLFLGGFILLGQKESGTSNILTPSVVKAVSAEDIYPLFICPCCGRTIDAGCCGMAQERMAYVDDLVADGLSEDEVVMSYIKNYGLDSFEDESQKQTFKEKLIAEAPSTRPIIVLSPDVYDFGDVSQSNGVVVTFFELTNNGKSDLVINKLETSCGCTSASIIYNGKEGPKFAMPGHGINEDIPDDWQVSIPAGGKAQVKVYYNPDMHPDFRGIAIREIYVFSNDPIDFEKSVKVELNQVD